MESKDQDLEFLVLVLLLFCVVCLVALTRLWGLKHQAAANNICALANKFENLARMVGGSLGIVLRNLAVKRSHGSGRYALVCGRLKALVHSHCGG